jgi:hypothetical protein
MVSSSPHGSFWWSRICSPVDTEGLCRGSHGHNSAGPQELRSSCWLFYFQNATVGLNINKKFFFAERWKIRFNKTANGVIRDVLNWLSHNVLCFNRITRFHGARVNLILFTHKRKTQGGLLRHFSLKSQVLRSRDPVTPNSTINVERRDSK